MPRRTQDEFTKPTGTVIGKGFTIHAARFSCSDSESMRIDGTVVGDIDIEGVINLSDSGRIDGNVNCGSARVAGRVSGNIKCRQALHLASTADITGDILATTLIVDDGAIFIGRCQTHIALDDLPELSYSAEW
jgi:cytoskeletal protein CcmA (bactofilin family)